MPFPAKALIFDPSERKWLSFSDPVDCIEAGTVESVEDALSRVEASVTERNLWAVGWVSYEASPAFDPSFKVIPDPVFPKVWFGLFRSPTLLSQLPAAEPHQPLSWSSTISQDEYLAAVRSIKERIARGDTYQVNYSFRLKAAAPSDPLRLFQTMVAAQAGAYSCFIETERFVIASASPELFFVKRGSEIRSRPMKGTRPRGRTHQEDQALAESLRSAVKDRAENTMIVDMVRNDLSRIAERDSVRVSSLCEVEQYPNVFQMTSDVVAQSHATLPALFRALFPPASITGAPKSNTMGIIANIETTPRRIYTGSVGWMAPDSSMSFNVAIRTTLIDKESATAEYGIGSGVVWDSKGEDEYRECLDKASALTIPSTPRELFETILWEPNLPGGFLLLEEHVNRLKESAHFHGVTFNPDLAREQLSKLHTSLETQHEPVRVRLRLSSDGLLSLEHGAFSPLLHPYNVSLATEPVRSTDRRLFHKTSDRAPYDEAIPSHPESVDVILWNERGEITESRIANIVVDIDGELVTPPLSCGLLAGCYRRHLLERGEIRERIILKADLPRATRIIFINSLRRSWNVHYLLNAEAESSVSTPSA